MTNRIIAAIPGDGIGNEVVPAAAACLITRRRVLGSTLIGASLTGVVTITLQTGR